MTFFSINARAPVVLQSADSFHERIEPTRESYIISAIRGYDTAAFTLHGEEDYLIDWFKHGLVRDLTFRGPDGAEAWNGFISRLSLSIGGITRTVSVDKTANRVNYIYTALDTGNNPPTAGVQTTITENDTVSQAAIGIKEVYVTATGGEATSTNAAVAALTELSKLSTPLVGKTQSVGRGQPPSLQVQLRGYSYIGDWFIYSQTANSGTLAADVVVLAVLAADPNSVLSTDTVNIDANATATERYWEKSPGWKVIQDITARGQSVGGVGTRWAAGIYQGRRLTFKAAEGLDSNGVELSTNKHSPLYRSVYDGGDPYFDEAGQEVDYWHLRPDRIVYTQGISGNPKYVRKVAFTPPIGIVLTGDDDVDVEAVIERS